jgi:hypothetical protein
VPRLAAPRSKGGGRLPTQVAPQSPYRRRVGLWPHQNQTWSDETGNFPAVRPSATMQWIRNRARTASRNLAGQKDPVLPVTIRGWAVKCAVARSDCWAEAGAMGRRLQLCRARLKNKSKRTWTRLSAGVLFMLGTPLHPNHPHQLLNRRRTLIQPRLLFRSKLDLNNLLNPLSPQLHRHADIETADPILAL